MNQQIALKSLDSMDRIAAHNKAKEIVIASYGDKPRREQFTNHSISNYPHYVTLTIVGLAMIMLIASFVASAMRLYHIGSETFGHSIQDGNSMMVAGIATVLMAEIGMVVFSLSLAVFDTKATARIILFGSIALSASIALVGNIQVAMPGSNVFAWLEAIAPPLLCLGTSFVLKSQMLHTIETRYECNKAYQVAIAEYNALTATPENAPTFRAAYANALRELIIKTNGKGRGMTERLEYMKTLSSEDWRLLIHRELQADNWYEPQADLSELKSKAVQTQGGVDFLALATPEPPTITITSNGNGKH